MGTVEGAAGELLKGFEELKREENSALTDSWIARFRAVFQKHGNIKVAVKNGMILKRCVTADGGYFESLED